MNGELYELARLALYTKRTMKNGNENEYKLGEYVNRMIFSFLPSEGSFFIKADECTDTQSWYKALQKRAVKEIHLVIFFEENNIKFAGFSNSAKQGLFTEYKDGKKTFWAAKWEFDSVSKSWTVYYKEFEWTGNSNLTYSFPECSKDFERALIDIEKLACKLGFDNFAYIFKDAYDILTSKDAPLIPEWTKDSMLDLQDEKAKLFWAASRADVFGGMGSWNDIPDCVAHEMGLQEDYDRLSHDLYISIKKAVMNAVNC